MDQAQTAEVQLRHLARGGVLHPDSAALAPLPVAPPDPPVQGRIRDPAAPGRQQLLDAGQLQPVPSEPLVDLVGPRGQHFFRRDLDLPRAGLADSCQSAQLLLARPSSLPGQAQLLGRSHILADRDPRQPGARRYLSQALSRLPAPYHFSYFHSGHLPVRHHRSSNLECGNGRRFGSQGGS